MQLRDSIGGLVLWVGLFAAPMLHAERVVLVAGGEEPVDARPATHSKLIGPFGVDFDRTGQMFIVEIAGHRVLKVDSSGVLTRVGGSGEKGGAGDGGPALEAQFNGMHSLAIGPDDAIYLADTWNNRVRKIDAKTGLISNVAGTGEQGFSGDGGPGREARMNGPIAAAARMKGRPRPRL